MGSSRTAPATRGGMRRHVRRGRADAARSRRPGSIEGAAEMHQGRRSRSQVPGHELRRDRRQRQACGLCRALGDDAAPGTRARPVRTLPAAVKLAAARHVDVYAMVGTYDVGTGLVLADHVSIYGGYTSGWKRSATQRVVIAGAPQGVVGTDVHFVTMQLLRIVASADGNVDRSVYGIRLLRSGVTLDHVTVSAACGDSQARTGSTKEVRARQALRESWASSRSARRPFPEARAQAMRAGTGASREARAAVRMGVPAQVPAAEPVVRSVQAARTPTVRTAVPAATAQPARPARTARQAGRDSTSQDRLWVGHDGGAGAAGVAGSGGGGGGGGGGWYTSNGAGTGGGGGGGGAGGSAGGGGDGGSYGGGSFGLYLWQSHATILSSTLHAGNGGPAGKGQNGGAGGPGGGGGSGGIRRLRGQRREGRERRQRRRRGCGWRRRGRAEPRSLPREGLDDPRPVVDVYLRYGWKRRPERGQSGVNGAAGALGG